MKPSFWWMGNMKPSFRLTPVPCTNLCSSWVKLQCTALSVTHSLAQGKCHLSWLCVGLIIDCLAPVQALLAPLIALYNLENPASSFRKGCLGSVLWGLHLCSSYPTAWAAPSPRMWTEAAVCFPSMHQPPSQGTWAQEYVHLSTGTQPAHPQLHAPEHCCGQAPTQSKEEEEVEKAPRSHCVSSEHPSSAPPHLTRCFNG